MTFSSRFSRPGLVGLVSAVLAAFGAVFPWITAEIAGRAASTGIDAFDILSLGFAIVAIGLVLLGGFESREPIGIIGYGLVIAGIGLWQLFVLGGTADPGFGLYLTLIGAVGLLAAGLWGYQAELTRPAGATAGYR